VALRRRHADLSRSDPGDLRLRALTRFTTGLVVVLALVPVGLLILMYLLVTQAS
jgi:hypothetical protein